MLYPSIFGENLVDSVFDGFDRAFNREFDKLSEHNPLYGKNASRLMSTDIRENDNAFLMAVDLPGMKKEDIKLTLNDGYLTISAGKNTENETKDDNGRLIRKERYVGSMERSFFVGEEVTEDDIKAKFEDGVLNLTIPKKEMKKVEAKTIAIE